MRFSRLRLSGFKSFVDPTELRIEDGLTGIVGPNGCGKSNLVEALRWVMGENAPSSMRSKGMEDVIFAGTARRPARNIAEVSLLIDNRERRAPALFNDADELEVSRRIERDMGSLYRINGREVRAKDVQLLFADASTGARSPSLVGQGRIAELINARPTDRRAILEEAAGIAGLHSRRREAEQKLRAAESNLARVQDVLDQLEQRISQLKRQARQAERYRTLSQRIRTLEAALLWRRWQEAGTALRASEQALQAAEAGLAEATGAHSALSREHAEAELALTPLREAANEAAAALQRLRLEREQLVREEATLAERTAALARQAEELEADAAHEEEGRADAAAALERLARERERLQALLEGARERENEHARTLRHAAREADRAEAEFDGLSQKWAVSRGRRASLQSDLLTLTRRADRIAEDLAALTEDSATEAALAQVSERVKEAAARLEAAEETARALAGEREALQDESEAAAGARNALLAEQAAVRAERSGIESEIATLERALERDARSGGDALAGLEVPEGLERAVGALVGEAAAARLEDGRDDASTTETAEKDGKGGPVAARPCWRILPTYPDSALPPLPAGATALSTLLPAVPDALSRRMALAGLVRADDPATLAREMRRMQPDLAPGQLLVSEDGLVAAWDGFFGHVGDEAEAAHRLVRRNRLKRLRKSLAAARRREEAIDDRLSEAERAHAVLEERLDALDARAREIEQERLSAARARDEAAREHARLEARRAAERERADSLARQAEEIAERRRELEAALAELPQEAALEKEVAEARRRLEEARRVLAETRAEYDRHAREREEAAGRLETLAHEEEAWRARLERAQRRLEDLGRRRKILAQERRRLADDPERLAKKRRAAEERIAELETAARTAADRLATAENRKRELDRALEAAREALSLARERRARLEADCTHARERLAEIVHEIEERLDIGPRTLAERMAAGEFAEAPPAIETLEEELTAVRAQRERLGAVNLRAEEEQAELVEQHDHLAGEREDLEQAIARLRQAISSLNREGRERLLKAFEAVDTHFGALFTRLFGGGHAHLELVESDDPLEAGIEIMASPPGKRLQSLSLLSGGEQTLTALSLVFAVFMTNPAPICVLDEVDAPLDEANVDRFCNLLDEMVARTGTRFLIVTHNEVTMARMHRLYGVTMAERGVSQLVSVDLERAETLLAAE